MSTSDLDRITSFQSRFVNVLAVDEVADDNSEFIYNYYTVDQSTNESGYEDPIYAGITYETIGRSVPRDEVTKWELYFRGEVAFDGAFATKEELLPRYVLLRWTPSTVGWSESSNWVTRDTGDEALTHGSSGEIGGWSYLSEEMMDWTDVWNSSDWGGGGATYSWADSAQTTPLVGTYGAGASATPYSSTHLADFMIESISYEESFQNAVFTGLNFQPTGFDKDIYNILSGYALIQAVIDERNETSSTTGIAGAEGDLLDVASAFVEALGLDEMNSALKKLLLRALSDYQSVGFYENAGGEVRAFSNIASLVDFNAAINKSLAINIVKRAAESFDNVFAKQLVHDIRNKAYQITNQMSYAGGDTYARQRAAGFVDAGDVAITEGGNINIFQLIPSFAFDPETTNENVWPIGYIVEKFREQESGTLVNFDRTFVNGRLTDSYFDPHVLYGVRYLYKVRTVFITQFFAYNVMDESSMYDSPDSMTTTSEEFVARLLMASRGCPEIIIDTFDSTAPEPPDILDFSYNPDEGGMVVSWESPIYNEGDLASFQIYRRSSLYDPYTLIGEIKWVPDDEITARYDRVPERLIETSAIVKTFFTDKEFVTTDDKRYYAVCATDKMGFVSGYSCQYYVTYDELRQRTNAAYISRKGAPRPYPNLYIREEIFDIATASPLTTTLFDFFVDTMKDSDHTKMKIYFDPDVYGIVGASPGRSIIDEDHELVEDYAGTVVNAKGGSTPAYKIIILNTDLQKSEIVDIFVIDTRL